MQRDYPKPLKKLSLFFLANPVSFNRQSHQKQKRPGTSAQLLLTLRNKLTKISLQTHISDQVWWCIKWLWSYSKDYTCKFMEANSWHKLFHFHLSFSVWKVWKGRGKMTKIWISREQKELFRCNKKRFSQFLNG